MVPMLSGKRLTSVDKAQGEKKKAATKRDGEMLDAANAKVAEEKKRHRELKQDIDKPGKRGARAKTDAQVKSDSTRKKKSLDKVTLAEEQLERLVLQVSSHTQSLHESDMSDLSDLFDISACSLI